jgi:oxysterol-binding protein 1
VPVYFNEPLSILQKAAAPYEFSDILDLAVKEQDPIKRLALHALFWTV